MWLTQLFVILGTARARDALSSAEAHVVYPTEYAGTSVAACLDLHDNCALWAGAGTQLAPEFATERTNARHTRGDSRGTAARAHAHYGTHARTRTHTLAAHARTCGAQSMPVIPALHISRDAGECSGTKWMFEECCTSCRAVAASGSAQTADTNIHHGAASVPTSSVHKEATGSRALHLFKWLITLMMCAPFMFFFFSRSKDRDADRAGHSADSEARTDGAQAATVAEAVAEAEAAAEAEETDIIETAAQMMQTAPDAGLKAGASEAKAEMAKAEVAEVAEMAEAPEAEQHRGSSPRGSSPRGSSPVLSLTSSSKPLASGSNTECGSMSSLSTLSRTPTDSAPATPPRKPRGLERHDVRSTPQPHGDSCYTLGCQR